jgi:phosphatidylserine/phosphatidylglycerophosphate/cardiolipin synthase-like enzyme
MRRLPLVVCVALVSLGLGSVTACVEPDDGEGEDLGSIGDGKEDSFGIVDRAVTIDPGRSRWFQFTADVGFRITVGQPVDDPATRQTIRLTLSSPDGADEPRVEDVEPGVVLDGDSMVPGPYRLTLRNLGDTRVELVLNVRPIARGILPDPNAAEPPPAEWTVPAMAEWPASYVIFNNTGCGHDCTQTDQTNLRPRSVMIKMVLAAIHEVKQGGTIRVSNFNISSSQSVAAVADALVWAINERDAKVRIVMDSAQNVAGSKTTWLAQQGADVRFLDGMHYESASEPGVERVGIMHNKMLVVDDAVLISGSNNFSSTGLVTNEENSVVLRSPAYADRIGEFACAHDRMFDAGVLPGEAQLPDEDPVRSAAIRGLSACNGPDTWFPPTGAMEADTSYTYKAVTDAIYNAARSIDLAPDMFAHPGLVSAILSRARRAKAAGEAFRIRVVLDASEEALHNPAFGECLAEGAAEEGLDITVKYWPGTAEIYQLLHHKFMVIDAEDPTKAALYNGSANYSAKAFKWSFENVTRFSGSSPLRGLVEAFSSRFVRLYGEGKTKERLAAEDSLSIPSCPL